MCLEITFWNFAVGIHHFYDQEIRDPSGKQHFSYSAMLFTTTEEGAHRQYQHKSNPQYFKKKYCHTWILIKIDTKFYIKLKYSCSLTEIALQHMKTMISKGNSLKIFFIKMQCQQDVSLRMVIYFPMKKINTRYFVSLMQLNVIISFL